MQDNPAETDGAGSSEAGDEEKPAKEPGIFARFLAFLTESDEDDEEAGKETDENTQLLEELNAEDKKGKKEKKKKEKKGKKAKGKEGDGEDAKAEKKKKPKKEKKEKPVDEEAQTESHDKKLSKKKIAPVILFCATILLCVLICALIVPEYMQKRDAHVAYDMGNYSQTFDLLFGKDLNEEEEAILQKSTIILKMERKLESYRNHQKIGADELETVNVLIQGAALYFELLPEAEQYNVVNEITEIYNEILVILAEQYAIYETDVIDIISSEDDITYTEKLTAVVYGLSFYGDTGIDEFGGMQDVLPEEQEILDNLPEEQEILHSMPEEQENSDNFTEELSDIPEFFEDEVTSGEVTMPDDEIRYIDPVSVEIHQNN